MTLEITHNGWSIATVTYVEYTKSEAIARLKNKTGLKYKRGVKVYSLDRRFRRVKLIA